MNCSRQREKFSGERAERKQRVTATVGKSTGSILFLFTGAASPAHIETREASARLSLRPSRRWAAADTPRCAARLMPNVGRLPHSTGKLYKCDQTPWPTLNSTYSC